MAEVIDLKRRAGAQRKERQALAQRRAGAVAAALSCGLCPRRCAHCGLAIEDPPIASSPAPYPFCGPCLEEYQAYCRREQGDASVEAFWHSPQWAEMWRAWLAHMRASDHFRRSPEFLRLMDAHQD
ncbi:MAG: hypothetical protein HY794_08255 [Desulfarculus sp.]|nr:hypothetical protein [Desulfarculus sp.]